MPVRLAEKATIPIKVRYITHVQVVPESEHSFSGVKLVKINDRHEKLQLKSKLIKLTRIHISLLFWYLVLGNMTSEQKCSILCHQVVKIHPDE